MQCSKCGQTLSPGEKYCTACGAVVAAAQAPQPPQGSPGGQQYGGNTPPTPPQYNAGSSGGQYDRNPYTYTPPQPPRYNENEEPLSIGSYLLMILVSAIPLVNLILLLIWAFGSNVNVNRQNYARAALIMGVIGIVLAIMLGGCTTMFAYDLYRYNMF